MRPVRDALPLGFHTEMADRRARRARRVAVCALAALAVVAVPGVASAHAVLASSQPQAGQRLGKIGRAHV